MARRKKSEQVDLTCTASSVAYVDTITGLKWVSGQTQRVSSADAKRIVKAVPQCKWRSVPAKGEPPAIPGPEHYRTTKRKVRVAPKDETPGFEVH